MKIVLTNDDGIDAPGIRALSNAIEEKTIFIAPRDEYSGCGHQVTTRCPIYMERRSEWEYAIAGTPADCIRLTIAHLCPDVDWVFSGINAGGNLGIDVYISGTIAAVREAALHGIPAIAISQVRQGGKPVDWERTTRWTRGVLRELLNRALERGSFWNVNLPYLAPGSAEADPELVFCQPSTEPLPIDYRIDGEYFQYVGDYMKRDRSPGTDVDVCFSGKIAVTQLKL